MNTLEIQALANFVSQPSTLKTALEEFLEAKQREAEQSAASYLRSEPSLSTASRCIRYAERADVFANWLAELESFVRTL